MPADTVIVRIAANNGSFLYDGTEKDLSGYTVTEISNELYTEDDFIFSGSSDLKGTNAGVYQTAMKAEDFANTNDNFANVIFEVTNGTLEITKRTVTMTSGSATKDYDGTALTSNEITYEGDGFVEGEEPVITMTGRQTRPGTSENTFLYELPVNASANNYEVTVAFGTLTMTESGMTHHLIIRYLDENDTEIGRFERGYAFGEAYNVTTPRLTGYQPDREKIAGTMGNADIEEIVRYSALTYTLTVDFTSTRDDSAAADPIVLRLKSGETYDITVPETEGFTPMVNEVKGVMPASDRTITVFMVPDGDEDQIGQYNAVVIDDYGTPLGVFNSVLGSGEIME